MRFAAIVDTLECILRKKAKLQQCKTEADADAIRITINELTAVLPPPESVRMLGSVRALAELNAEMTDIAEQLTANEKEIDRRVKEAAKDSWKWSGRKEGPKEPAAVTALRATNTELQERLDALDLKAEPFRKLLAAEQRALDDEAQLQAWVARNYADPCPATIQAMRDHEHRTLEADCVRIPMHRKLSCIVIT